MTWEWVVLILGILGEFVIAYGISIWDKTYEDENKENTYENEETNPTFH